MTPPFLEERGFLHKIDYAAAIGVCDKTVTRQMAKGLPHLELGGKTWIGPKEQVDAWLMQRVKRLNPARNATQRSYQRKR
jgi:hypothetical protein